MILLYVISFIMGGLISFILYGKVPVIVSLIISFMVGGLIGYIYNKIRQKKAEREYGEWMIMQSNIILNGNKEES